MKNQRKRQSKSAITMVLTASMLVAPLPVFAANDLVGHWARDTVETWQDKGLISGYADGSFLPDMSITRAEFIQLINKSLNMTKKGSISFSDVNTRNWFYEAVSIAVGEGYASGMTDGTFRPNGSLTRAEAATMVYNATGKTGGTINGFTDRASIPSWATSAVAAMVNAGYLSGYPDGTFRPHKVLTRAEAVSVLNRAMGGGGTGSSSRPEANKDPVITDKDLLIDQDGTEVSNKTVEGNVVISSRVGSGEVELEKVTIKGDLIINGGGKNTVELKDITVKGDTIINKADVRVRLEGKTKLNEVQIRENCNLQGKNFKGSVGEIVIENALDDTTTIGIPAKTLTIERKASVNITEDIDTIFIEERAAGSRVDIPKDISVDTLTADGRASITGEGTIKLLEANADGIRIQKSLKVTKQELGRGVDDPTIETGSSDVKTVSIKTAPTKTTYKAGESLDVSGLVLTATYKDDSSEDVVATSSMVSGFDSSTKGTKTLTVTYLKKSTTYTVTVTVDTAILTTAITAATTNKATAVASVDGSDVESGKKWVPQTVMTAYETAITAAQGVLAKQDASQTEINNAANTLTAATATFSNAKLDGKKQSTVDKTNLIKAIDDAKANRNSVSIDTDGNKTFVDKTWVTQGVADVYSAAIAAAEKISTKVDAEQKDVEDATTALIAATSVFDKAKAPGKNAIVDKTSLTTAITDASANQRSASVADSGKNIYKDEFWVTPDVFNAYSAAIKAAEAVAKNPDATREDVAEAVKALKGATDAFNTNKKVGEKKPLELGALTNAIAAAKTSKNTVKDSVDGKDIDPRQKWVTKEVMKALTDAIAAAETVHKDVTATQEQVNTATTALTTATATFTAAPRLSGMKPMVLDGQSGMVVQGVGGRVTFNLNTTAELQGKGVTVAMKPVMPGGAVPEITVPGKSNIGNTSTLLEFTVGTKVIAGSYEFTVTVGNALDTIVATGSIRVDAPAIPPVTPLVGK